MAWKKAARIVLPLSIAFIAMLGLYIYASASHAVTPRAKDGVLSLAEWNKKGAFEISGEWEFYWNKALTDAQIKGGVIPPIRRAASESAASAPLS